MERPDYESLSSLLKDRPLPWSPIPGLKPGESEIIASNGKPVMRITTNVQNHQAILDLLRYMLPHKMPELKKPRTLPQMEDEIAVIQGEIGAAIYESMEEFGMAAPEPFDSPTKEH